MSATLKQEGLKFVSLTITKQYSGALCSTYTKGGSVEGDRLIHRSIYQNLL